MSSWRGGGGRARREGGISNGWGEREEGRESGDKWRLDPTRLRNSTATDGLRLVLRREELRERANLAAAAEVIMRRNEL